MSTTNGSYPNLPPEDILLIKKVIAGDVDQFNIFVDLYQDRIFKFFIKRFNDPVTAADLAQDVFVEAYRKLCNFQGNSKFSTWLFGIALNIARNYSNRSPDMRMKSNPIPLSTASTDKGENYLEDFLREKSLLVFKKEMDNLPDDLREALLMVSFEEFTYMETAAIINIPIGTVKSRVYKARQLLQDAMKRY